VPGFILRWAPTYCERASTRAQSAPLRVAAEVGKAPTRPHPLFPDIGNPCSDYQCRYSDYQYRYSEFCATDNRNSGTCELAHEEARARRVERQRLRTAVLGQPRAPRCNVDTAALQRRHRVATQTPRCNVGLATGLTGRSAWGSLLPPGVLTGYSQGTQGAARVTDDLQVRSGAQIRAHAHRLHRAVNAPLVEPMNWGRPRRPILERPRTIAAGRQPNQLQPPGHAEQPLRGASMHRGRLCSAAQCSRSSR
jgi:hypothetical protein